MKQQLFVVIVVLLSVATLASAYPTSIDIKSILELEEAERISTGFELESNVNNHDINNNNHKNNDKYQHKHNMSAKQIIKQAKQYLKARNVNDASFQIHTHWTGVMSERVVSYVTPSNRTSKTQPSSQVPPSTVLYGLSVNQLNNTVTGTPYEFGTDGHYMFIHTLILSNLQLDTRYFYKVGSDVTGWSDIHAFVTKSSNFTYAVYGDFGYTNDRSITKLNQDLEAGLFDAVLHVGDFAYDLDSENGTVGDSFMSVIQEVASAVPYMTCPGNHEKYNNFTHYINRFSGIYAAGKNCKSNTNLWYSYDVDNIHFVVIDTEVYAYSVDPAQIKRQLDWLEADLINANQNRDRTPWIVLFGHKAEYMDHTDWSGFWPLTHKYGVDLYLTGHQHNYQRLLPYYQSNIDHQANKNQYINPKYMVTIIVGSPGCNEGISDSLGPSSVSVFSSLNYGFGYMKAHNSTHLHWTWQQTASGSYATSKQTPTTDELWIIQENH